MLSHDVTSWILNIIGETRIVILKSIVVAYLPCNNSIVDL